jgi:glutaminyl-peptide cyclotransferase
MKKCALYLLSIPILFLFTYCTTEDRTGLQFTEQGRSVPEFSSDNAYQYIVDQVSMGPRVPNTSAHREAIQYFNRHFREFAGNNSVFVQSFQTEVYGDTLNLYNLIASFGVEHSDRILLAAHWDSRPRAEEDPNDPDSPILGADDGASGVAVLMEFAKIFSEHQLPIGVDIILFDGEDYGLPSDLDNYFLGSRHWGNNQPVPGYSPRFGILLDMVGGENAVFPKEGYSMRFAPNLVDEIWSIAKEFNYSDLFIDERGGMIADDHIIVERLTGIPMINIIHHRLDAAGNVNFPPYWHTHNDNLEIIDKDVLQAVGEVLLELIYNRIPS